MTSRPEMIPVDRSLLPGLVGVGFFALFAAIVLSAEYGAVEGFAEEGLSIVEDIGYALIGGSSEATIETEDFLVALILIAVLLDAALDSALMLATRDDGGDS